MRRLSYTRRAQADLDSIGAFLRTQANGRVAAEQLERIRTAANRLRDFPELGATHAEGSYRMLRVRRTPFSLFYDGSADEVRILRVLHGARDRSDLC